MRTSPRKMGAQGADGWGILFSATSRATFSGDFAEFFGVPHGPDYGELANTWAAVYPDDIETITAARQAAVAPMCEW